MMYLFELCTEGAVIYFVVSCIASVLSHIFKGK